MNKLTRRDFAKFAGMAGVGAFVLPEILMTTGCPKIGADQIVAGLQVGEEIWAAAIPIIAAGNPAAAGIMSLADVGLKDLLTLYNKFEAASATEKPGVAGQIHALLNTLTGNLSTVLADVHIKNPDLVKYIDIAVAVVNTGFGYLLKKLPTGSVAAQSSILQTQALPVIPKAKSASDLKKAWNAAVGAAHPEAMVK